MAQGGQGWPGGHYDPGNGSLQNVSDGHQGSMGFDSATYDFHHFGEPSAHSNTYLYSGGYQATDGHQQNNAPYSSTTFPTNGQPNAETPPQFAGQGIYSSATFQPESHRLPAPQSAPYRADVNPYAAAAYSESGYPYNTAQNMQPNQVSADYDRDGWQPQQAQGQFGTHVANYSDSSLYNPQLNVMSQPRVPTPASRQRASSHFGAAQSPPSATGLVNDGDRATPQLARQTGGQSQQFQGQQVQFVNSSFPAPSSTSPDPSRSYQMHTPQPGQSAPMAGQLVGHLPVPQAVSQPPPFHANGAQATMTRTGSIPASRSVAQSSAESVVTAPYSNTALNLAQPQGYPELSQSETQPVPSITPQAEVGFAQITWKPIQGCPNLLISDMPVHQGGIDPKWNASKVLALPYNSNFSLLLPSRIKRLPGEIKRDFEEIDNFLRTHQPDDAQRKILAQKAEQLKAEMEDVIGKKGQLRFKKGTTGIKSKAVRAQKAGSKSPDDTSDADSDQEEDEITKKAHQIKMATRPTDPVRAVQYDVVKMVWREESEPPEPAKAIQAFGNYVAKLWNRVKKLKEEIKAEKSSSKVASLQKAVDKELEYIRIAVETVNDYAEDDVLRNMGGNQRLFSMLTNALRHSLAKAPKGPLPKAILSLMAYFRNVEKTFLTESLKLDRTRAKYREHLDEESRMEFDEIFTNAKEPEAKMSTAKESETKMKVLRPSTEVRKEHVTQKPPAFTAKDLVSASKKKATSAGATSLESRRAANSDVKSATNSSPHKRARDDEVDSRASKKLAVEGAANKDQAGKIVSSTNAPATTQPSSTAAQPRSRTTPSILSGRARPVVKPPVKKLDPPPSSSSMSTISGLLAEIEKPKPAPKAREEPARAPETAEEKERRLRKEARRGLRVMWKPDHELIEVRLFQHDVAEDEGRGSNMVKDALDARSEGQAFKRGFREEEHDMDIDVDGDGDGEEEQGKVKEFSMRPWNDISAVDFSTLPKEKRDENIVTRGGAVEFRTDEQKFMEEYEKREMMAIYTTFEDIPESPRSPPRKAVDAAAASPPKIATLPSDKPEFLEFHRRATETKQFGQNTALQLAVQRLGTGDVSKLMGAITSASAVDHTKPDSSFRYSSVGTMSQAPSGGNLDHMPFSSMTSQAERDAEVFKLLNSEAVKNWVDPSPHDPAHPKTQRRHDYVDPKIQADIDNFEAVAAYLKDKPSPATEPPVHLRHRPERVQEWQRGHSSDLVAKAKAEATKRATEFAQNHARSQNAAGQPFVPPTVQQPPTGQPNADYNAALWANYFAQQNQSQGQPYATTAPQPQHLAAAQQQGLDPYAFLQALQIQQSSQGAAVSVPQPGTAGAQDANTQLQQILSNLGGAQAPTSNDDIANYWRSLAQSAQTGQPMQSEPSTHQYHQHNRDQDRDRDHGHRQHYGNTNNDGGLDYGSVPGSGSGDWSNRDKGNRGRKDRDNFHGRGGKDFSKGINRALIGTKPCLFWAKGLCAKGDQCTFRHDPNDLK